MEDTKKQKNFKYLVIALLAIIALGVFYLVFKNNNSKVLAGPAMISGEIDFNGIKPDGSEGGSVTIKAREHETDGEYIDTGVTVDLVDKVNWEWDGAESGITYDLIAEATHGSIVIDQSQRSVATAPATNVFLVFNTTIDDIPEELHEQAGVGKQSSISAVYMINGYIPDGSVFNVYAREQGADEFVEVSSDIPAKSGTVIDYDEAVAGTTYEAQAELYTKDGTFIGQSPYITVTAPAKNEKVVINSTASAPEQTATISGSINVNGPFEQGSTILLLQREHGDTSDHSVIERYSAEKSIDFEWKDAVAGKVYELTTVLQIDGDNSAKGNVVTVSAPAKDIDLELDTKFNLTAPNETARIACGSADSTNHYNAKIEFQQFENAKAYHLEVGTSPGANNIYNGQVEPRSAATVFVNSNTDYFTRYAYTACDDCHISDPTNWSGWSPTIGFKCPN